MIKNKYLSQIEKTLDLYFGKKAPPIPENIKKLIVQYSPYLIILAIILSLPSLFVAFGLRAFWAPFSYGNRVFSFSFLALLSLVALIIEGMAVPGLLKRTRQSWEYLFYASLITVLVSFLSLNLGSFIIGGAITFYILFQIKSYYKN